MDYTFGLSKEALDTFGAKSAVFDRIRELDNGPHAPSIYILPYFKVPVDMAPAEAQKGVVELPRVQYYVVRVSSKYELLPGTAGLTESKRFVTSTQIAETIEKLREPSGEYLGFVEHHNLEPESAFPMLVPPMYAESFGFVTGHPNQDLTLVDYFEGDDSEERFRYSYILGSSDGLDRVLAKADLLLSERYLAASTKYYGRYSSSKFLEGNVEKHRNLFDYMNKSFGLLDSIDGIFEGNYSRQCEWGHTPHGTTILYQYRPFRPIKRAAFSIDTTNADIVFGICEQMEYPVVRMKDALNINGDMDDEEIGTAIQAIEIGTQLDDIGLYKLGIKAFQQRMLGKIKEEHGDDVILAMRSYGRLECLDFTILKPRAVVISDNFRAGMIHNRTNLIQSVPVVIFGNMLHYSKCESARISCDGRNALIEEL